MPPFRSRQQGQWSGSARSTPSVPSSGRRRPRTSQQQSSAGQGIRRGRSRVPAYGFLRTRPDAPKSSPRGSSAQLHPAGGFRGHVSNDVSPDLFLRTSSTIPPEHHAEEPITVENQPEPFRAEVIMALGLTDNGTMGCAYFENEKGAMYLCKDMPLSDLETAEQLLAHIQPTTMLVSGRAPEHLMTFLEKRAIVEENGQQTSQFIFRALASSEFALKAAQDKLVNLQASISPQNQAILTTSEEHDPETMEGAVDGALVGNSEHRNIKLIRCGATVDLDSLISVCTRAYHAELTADDAKVCCAGALLSEISRRRSNEYLPDGTGSGSTFKVEILEVFSLADSMYITQDTMQALQIMRSEQHPNSKISGGVQSASGSKESLSIYGLFHHFAGTPQGKTALRKMFLWPTTNLGIINSRLEFIAFFRRPENAEHLMTAWKTCKKIANVRRNLNQLQKGAESPSMGQSDKKGAWATLKGFVTHVSRLRGIVASMRGYDGLELLSKLVDEIPLAPLIAVGDMIERTIDFEDSEARLRSCVKAGIDPQLDEIKRQYDGMTSFLTHVVVHLRKQIPDWAAQYIKSCIFLPQLGFLTVVEHDSISGNGKFEGEGAQLQEWTKLFVDRDGACYKNSYMKDLDEEYGDVYCEIGDREVEILYDLTKKVLEHQDVLAKASDLCGQFDALLALALGAEKYDWSRPELTDSPSILQIEEGRHALQELVVPCFVPNCCVMGVPASLPGDSGDDIAHGPRALVLTGPNHSGKSVYLKQTATIIYLAQIGSYVPAKKAVIGIVDKILARVSSKESVSKAESAFAMDLKQVAQVVRGATEKSVVLIDEFGKGTSSDDGAGLMTALIDYFLGRNSECPRLLIATHFHEIFEGGYLDPHHLLQLAHLEVRVEEGGTEEEGTQLTYLFTLAPGHSSSSFGGQCAALNGVPSTVVRRADVISEKIARNEDLVTACAKLSVREQAALESAETVARRFLQADLEELETREEDDESPSKELLQQVLQL